MPKRPTLQDIANQAGVSRWTACQALKNNPEVAEKTKKRIKSIARKIGYHPNAFASALVRSRKIKTQDKGTIAFIIGHDKFNPLSKNLKKTYPNLYDFYHPTFKGAADKAKQYGYHLDFFWAYDPAHRGKRLDRILQSRGIHALLLFEINQSELQLDWSKYACAYTNLGLAFNHKDILFSFSAINYYKLTFSAINNLLNRGYRRIGLFMWRTHEELQDFSFYGGYHSALKYNKMPKSCHIPPHYWSYLINDQAFLQWMNRYQPEVLITPGGITSPGVFDSSKKFVHFLDEYNLKIPEDIEFVHLKLNSLLKKNNFTGFSIPHYSISASAVDLIVNQLHHNEYGPRKLDELKSIYLQPKWIEGKTLLRKNKKTKKSNAE